MHLFTEERSTVRWQPGVTLFDIPQLRKVEGKARVLCHSSAQRISRLLSSSALAGTHENIELRVAILFGSSV